LLRRLLLCCLLLGDNMLGQLLRRQLLYVRIVRDAVLQPAVL